MIHFLGHVWDEDKSHAAHAVALWTSRETRWCLNPGAKVYGCHLGMLYGSVRIIIIKQITEVLSNPRDEFIKPN